MVNWPTAAQGGRVGPSGRWPRHLRRSGLRSRSARPATVQPGLSVAAAQLSQDDSSERDLVGSARACGRRADEQPRAPRWAGPRGSSRRVPVGRRPGRPPAEDERGVRRYVAQQAGVGATRDQPIAGQQVHRVGLGEQSGRGLATTVVRPVPGSLAAAWTTTAPRWPRRQRTSGRPPTDRRVRARTARASRTRCLCPPERLPPPTRPGEASPLAARQQTTSSPAATWSRPQHTLAGRRRRNRPAITSRRTSRRTGRRRCRRPARPPRSATGSRSVNSVRPKPFQVAPAGSHRAGPEGRRRRSAVPWRPR